MRCIRIDDDPNSERDQPIERMGNFPVFVYGRGAMWQGFLQYLIYHYFDVFISKIQRPRDGKYETQEKCEIQGERNLKMSLYPVSSKRSQCIQDYSVASEMLYMLDDELL